MLQHFYEPEKRYKEKERPYKTKEGEAVFSRGELKIANFLHDEGIDYHYEPKREIEGRMWCPDFYLWKLDVYIEFQGMADDEQAKKHYAVRYMAMKNAGFRVIYLYESQRSRLGKIITEKLQELQDKEAS